MAAVLVAMTAGCADGDRAPGLDPQVPVRPDMGNVTTPSPEPVDVPLSVRMKAPEDARRITFEPTGPEIEVTLEVPNGARVFFVVLDGDGELLWSDHAADHGFVVPEAKGPWTVWTRGDEDSLLLVDGVRGASTPVDPIVTSEQYTTTVIGGQQEITMAPGAVFITLDAQIGQHHMEDQAGRVIASWPDTPAGLIGAASSLTLVSEIGAVGDVVVTQTSL